MARSHQKRRKRRLWESNPNCHWCGQTTIWPSSPKERNKENEATLDHLNSRLSEKRYVPNFTQEIRTVLACRKCNEARAKQEESLLSKEELWRRSKRSPRILNDSSSSS